MDQKVLEILAYNTTGMLKDTESQSISTWENQSVENLQLVDMLRFIEEEKSALANYKSFSLPNPPQVHTRWKLLMVVAVILFAIILAYFAFSATQNSQDYQVAFLEDNSEVYLFDGASINISPDFNETSRELTLVGSAFFDIVHEETKPFVIHHNHGSITVLGTSFTVESTDDFTQVTVRDGKVLLKHINTKEVVLEAGQSFRFMENALVNSDTETPFNFLFSGSYQNEEIQSIILDLAKSHNMSIFMDQAFLDSSCLYNGEFVNASVQEVLYEFSLLFDLQFEIVKNELRLLNTSCK